MHNPLAKEAAQAYMQHYQLNHDDAFEAAASGCFHTRGPCAARA